MTSCALPVKEAAHYEYRTKEPSLDRTRMDMAANRDGRSFFFEHCLGRLGRRSRSRLCRVFKKRPKRCKSSFIMKVVVVVSADIDMDIMEAV